ncbi:MAG: hypothetical protein Q6373_017495 [Candidatus Sigynarchaeota archaeon]
MSAISFLQKILIVALVVVSLPIFALNVITPRLAIATGDLNIKFRDITVVSFTNSSGFPAPGYDPKIKDTATLDFWLEVGLPVRNDNLKNATHDLRYYIDDKYTVNEANLKDPNQEVIIPIINIVAKYNDKIIGRGGSHRQYVLNKHHPVEYVHLYLTESRMPDGGLMFLFNSLASSGVLDQILFSSLMDSGGEGPGFESLLKDLKLEITTFIGGAPLSLPLDLSAFGLSPFPVITPASTVPDWIFDKNNTIIYYNNSRQVKDFDRLMNQLGLVGSSDPFELLKSIFSLVGVGSTDQEILNALQIMFNQLFPADEFIYSVRTVGKWWCNGTNASRDAAYSQAEMEDLVRNEILNFKAVHDLFDTLSMTEVNARINNGTSLRTYLEGWASAQSPSKTTVMNSMILNNQTSWFHRLYVLAMERLPLSRLISDFVSISDATETYELFNIARGQTIVVQIKKSIVDLFGVLEALNLGLSDMFQGLQTDVPTLITALLLHSLNPNDIRLLGEPYKPEIKELNTQGTWYTVSPDIAGIQGYALLLFTIIASFLIVFGLLATTKARVKMNRADFLARETVAKNVKDFISRVEQLGGKVSVQNAESLAIRAYRTEGKIDSRPEDIEKRAKAYVENQKLLVTLQSRASRAYVAQKFKDCIGAIEKMIQIARKLEDQTLVQNYEENLAKVVRLLRRKGISVSTKVRVEEGAKPGEEVEQLSIYKKELIDLQNRASKAFAEKNFTEAKEAIKQMLAIAKKIQDPVLIRNYEANLRKIIAMEKGGSV